MLYFLLFLRIVEINLLFLIPFEEVIFLVNIFRRHLRHCRVIKSLFLCVCAPATFLWLCYFVHNNMIFFSALNAFFSIWILAIICASWNKKIMCATNIIFFMFFLLSFTWKILLNKILFLHNYRIKTFLNMHNSKYAHI